MQNKDILPVLKLLYNRNMEFSFGTISNFKRKVPRYFKQNEHEILSSFSQVNAISEQALKQKVDTVSNKASRL